MIKRAEKANKESAQLLYEKRRENISLTDHSLRDLRRLGYPYSRVRPKKIHDPEWLVHVQKGQLLDSLKEVTKVTPMRFTPKVGCDEEVAPHVQCIVMGTSKMVSRDFIRGSFEEVQDEIKEIVRKNLVGAS